MDVWSDGRLWATATTKDDRRRACSLSPLHPPSLHVTRLNPTSQRASFHPSRPFRRLSETDYLQKCIVTRPSRTPKKKGQVCQGKVSSRQQRKKGCPEIEDPRDTLRLAEQARTGTREAPQKGIKRGSELEARGLSCPSCPSLLFSSHTLNIHALENLRLRCGPRPSLSSSSERVSCSR